MRFPWWLTWEKNLPAMQETQEAWVQSLGPEDPLEKGKATHSRILARRIPWTEEPGGLQSVGSQSRTRTLNQLVTLQKSFLNKLYVLV